MDKYRNKIHIYHVVGSDKKEHLIFAHDKQGFIDPDESFDVGNPKVIHLLLLLT